jgi:hypothetical protein
MSAPADDDVVVHGDAERGGDVDDRFRHLDVRTRRRGIAARMVVHQDDRSIACCTCLRQLMAAQSGRAARLDECPLLEEQPADMFRKCRHFRF